MEMEELRLHFYGLGLVIPDWLLRQQPNLVVINGESYLVTADGAFFEAEQFRPENVQFRYNLITIVSN